MQLLDNNDNMPFLVAVCWIGPQGMSRAFWYNPAVPAAAAARMRATLATPPTTSIPFATPRDDMMFKRALANPQAWSEHTSPGGKTFYYNSVCAWRALHLVPALVTSTCNM